MPLTLQARTQKSMLTQNYFWPSATAQLAGGVLLSAALACSSLTVRADSAALAWPAIGTQTRPWSYWWWMGSAVDTNNLTKELTRYRDTGFGGVHIIPIYGAKGWETNYIRYLSPKWMDMLCYTVSEANRLGLGV